MGTRVGILGLVGLLSTTSELLAQNLPGRKTFEGRCARCHGADGNGGEMGPPIVAAAADARRRAAGRS